MENSEATWKNAKKCKKRFDETNQKFMHIIFPLFALWTMARTSKFYPKIAMFGIFKNYALTFYRSKKSFILVQFFYQTSFYYLEPTNKWLLLVNITIMHLFRMKNSLALFGQNLKFRSLSFVEKLHGLFFLQNGTFGLDG